MRRQFNKPRALTLLTVVCIVGLLKDPVEAAIVAADTASNIAYATESGGAWKGLYPTVGENPPGTDNGGYGFTAWDFFGGFHQPEYSAYGNLNHFIAGVDFPTTSYNSLGAQAFALTNSNFAPGCGTVCAFGGETSRATRSFASPLVPGDTVTVRFDNPLLTPEVAWFSAGFLIRFNTGHGPVASNHPSSTAVERFGMFADTGLNGAPGIFGDNWAIADGSGNTNTGVNVNTTVSGAELRFTLETAETYSVDVTRVSNGDVLFSRTGSLSSLGSGTIDSIEIALFGNGSGNGVTGATMQATGEREFYFNDLSIEHASATADYNNDGTVDAADYVLWKKDSSIGDYATWRTHFGEALAGGGSSVPEPTGLVIAAVILAALSQTRRPSRFSLN